MATVFTSAVPNLDPLVKAVAGVAVVNPNGDRYEGESHDGKAHGRGILTRANGDRYEGEFHDGKPHGRGFQTWENGSHYYEGEFHDGKPHGRGFRSSSGVGHYEGEFHDGKPHGRGVFYNGELGDDGAFYDGTFRDGEIDISCPVVAMMDGRRYEGEINADWQPHGRGILTGGNLQHGRYEGDFHNGRFRGRGVYRDGSYQYCEGEFRNGVPHGQCTLVVRSSRRSWLYEGEFRNGKAQGRGSDVFDGEYRDAESSDITTLAKGMFSADLYWLSYEDWPYDEDYDEDDED